MQCHSGCRHRVPAFCRSDDRLRAEPGIRSHGLKVMESGLATWRGRPEWLNPGLGTTRRIRFIQFIFVQGIEIPCSRPKIPCSCEKIPCSFGLREFGLQRIEI